MYFWPWLLIGISRIVSNVMVVYLACPCLMEQHKWDLTVVRTDPLHRRSSLFVGARQLAVPGEAVSLALL